MSESKFFYSYTDFVKERINFKKVDREGINRYDSPAALYYKLVFYFTEDSGLLGLHGVFSDYDTNRIKNICGAFYDTISPDDCDIDASNADNITYKDITAETLKNTAYNYLLLNAEYERAQLLGNFITLLSEINSSSPW
jgi:hypothetical protein